MKITEEKHNHKLTNLLKVFIFSVLMILPFLNVAVRCGYVMLNKNAYQSYYGETINEVTYKDITIDDLEINENYYLNVPIQTKLTGNLKLYFNDDITINNNNYSNYQYIEFFQTGNEAYAALAGTSASTIYYVLNNNSLNINFNYNHITNNNSTLEYQLTKKEYNSYSYLDNVFEYSVNKLQEEQYLTWTQNTAVYQGVETMTTQLGITQTVIPMLIVYWFMLTIIYVIIDIVLALFTKLTHMIGNKTT